MLTRAMRHVLPFVARLPRFFVYVAMGFLWGGRAVAVEPAGCAGPVLQTGSHVRRMSSDGSLTLGNGRVAVLDGIRLPQGAADHASPKFAERARAEIRDLVAKGSLVLRGTPPLRDRYGRWRVQIVAKGLWLQRRLLQDGLARVEIAPSHPQCADGLFSAETAARNVRRGLWSSPAYAVRTPQTLVHDTGAFQLVEGRVVSAAVKGGRAYLNFGTDWRHDFTVTISPGDMKTFRKQHVDPRQFAGKMILVRGIVGWYRGPEIVVAGPQGIQLIP